MCAQKNCSSCIDMKFTTLPELEIEPGIHLALPLVCHDKIIHAKFDLKIYARDYTKKIFPRYFFWEKTSLNLKVNEKDCVFCCKIILHMKYYYLMTEIQRFNKKD